MTTPTATTPPTTPTATLTPTPTPTTPQTGPTTTTAGSPVATGRTRTAPPPIPFRRLLAVELSKMFNTRAGFWLMAAIGATGLIATAVVIAFVGHSSLTYDTFAGAIGVPMTVLLPIMALLAVTAEWSQRTGLTTFTLVPHRGRVIGAKATVALSVGLVSILLALGLGAIGNLVGASIAGIDPVWDIPVSQVIGLCLANVLNLLVGFTLGVLIRNSAGAIVGYFVYSFVVPTLSMVLGANQTWWEHARPWLDFNWAQGALYDGWLSATEWAQLGTSSVLWLFGPLAVGLWLVSRSEVRSA